MEKKMDYFLIALAVFCFILVGCSSKIIWSPNGDFEASNYSINETLDSKGKVVSRTYTPFVPDRWYSDALDKIGPMFGQLSPLIKMWIDATKIVPVPTPAPPAPVPAPVPPTPEPPVPTPYPAPVPTPVPVPTPASTVFTQTGNVITLDMNTLPRSMGQAGFLVSDNGLYYAMAFIYAYGPGQTMPDDSAGTLIPINTPEKRAEIYKWFDNEVMKVRSMMQANSALTLVAITNDGVDKCGFRLGPPILERLKEFGNRISLGEIYVYATSDAKKKGKK